MARMMTEGQPGQRRGINFELNLTEYSPFSPREKVADRSDEGLITSEIFKNWTRDKTLIRPLGTFPRRGKGEVNLPLRARRIPADHRSRCHQLTQQCQNRCA